MATVNLSGDPCSISGDLPRVGEPAPAFSLTGSDLKDLTLADFAGKRLLLNIFPSVDTPVCAQSVRRFNEEAASLPGTEVLCVSRDLPFAQSRFCGAEDLDRVKCASEMRSGAFGEAYGVRIVDGVLAGLFARAIVVVDPSGNVAHSQLVPEITEEPDYAAAVAACA